MWLLPALQLTQKKTALQFKTVDQTLQTYNKDTFEKQALSYRCSDIDRLVPQAMGVSKVRGWQLPTIICLTSNFWSLQQGGLKGWGPAGLLLALLLCPFWLQAQPVQAPLRPHVAWLPSTL